MSKALVLGAAVLAFSAGAASAQFPGYDYNGAVVPLYGPGYGYAATAPLYNYAAPADGSGAVAPAIGDDRDARSGLLSSSGGVRVL